MDLTEKNGMRNTVSIGIINGNYILLDPEKDKNTAKMAIFFVS